MSARGNHSIDADRDTAYGWHGGQFSPLYAWASTCTVVEGVLAEVDQCVQGVHAQRVDGTERDVLLGELAELRQRLVSEGAQS